MDFKPKNMMPMRKEVRVALISTLSAAIFLGGIIGLVASADNNYDDVYDPDTNTHDGGSEETDLIVFNPLTEVLAKPTKGDVKIATYFYDPTDDASIRENAIINVPGSSDTYTKSLGVDYNSNNQFDVLAVASGTVISKGNDGTYGNMILIEHETGAQFIYCSLGKININKGDTVSQGDVIATSGESLYTSGLGQSLHFEVLNSEGEYVNPEKSYSLVVAEL